MSRTPKEFFERKKVTDSIGMRPLRAASRHLKSPRGYAWSFSGGRLNLCREAVRFEDAWLPWLERRRYSYLSNTGGFVYVTRWDRPGFSFCWDDCHSEDEYGSVEEAASALIAVLTYYYRELHRQAGEADREKLDSLEEYERDQLSSETSAQEEQK